MTPDARLQEIRLELLSRNPENKIDPTLDRIRAAAELLGDPQLSYPVVHVAGTNGKTTTSRMIERLLREFGLTTGLMTSPHLHDERERIRINGEPVDAQRFVEAYEEIEPYLGLIDDRVGRLSYFEVLTLLGFMIFADAPVGVAVIEVGLGGELDASNIVEPAVTVITPIGMDHQEYLGDTLELIARAKAGILKPNAIPVIARQELAAAEVITARAAMLGLPLLREGVEFGVTERQVAIGGQLLTLQGVTGEYTDVLLQLHGDHQAANAATALAAVESFFGASSRLDDDVVRAGFADVTSPGRCEVVRRSPTVIVDAAHNPHGAAALAATLQDAFDFRRLVGVIAVLAEKDAHGVLEALESVLDEVVITRNGSPRALEIDSLAAIAVEVFGEERVHVSPSLTDAAELATELVDRADSGEGGLGIVFTGSVVTAAEARAMFGRTAV